MGKIVTNEIFQEQVKDLINPDLKLLGKYIDSKTKISCKCKKCGYQWEMLPSNIKNGRGCPKCANKNKGDSKRGSAKLKNQEKLEQISKEKNYILLSEYIDSKTKIKCKCNICGYEWEALPGNLLKSQGCYVCGRKSTSEKLKLRGQVGKENYTCTSKTYNKVQSLDKQKLFLERAIKIHPEYDYSNTVYKTASDNISIICPKHGEFTVYAGNFLYRGIGCHYCKMEEKRKTPEQFEKELYLINNDLLLLNKYINWDIKVKVQCKKCRNIWESYPLNLLRGRGCPKCKQSKGEKQIESFLKQYKIKYIPQYSINILKEINISEKTYIDFYLPDYNMFIEYNGEQHYIPIQYFGGQLAFEHQIKRDNYVRDYCNINNINLLEISYQDINNIDYILKEHIINESSIGIL